MGDVVLLRIRVTSGWPQRLMDVFVRVLIAEQFVMQHGGLVGRVFRHWLNNQLEPILVEEEMYTETIFLDRSDGDLYLLWYMEAEDMATVYESFVASDHSLTDIAERVADWLFEDPERILSPEVSSDYPLLAHAWHPDRP